MKIEIGESLVRTWMRHCEGCQLAELNWKPSRGWTEEGTLSKQEKWFAEGMARFGATIFKQTSSLSQFLGQAEIDVLGVHFAQGKVDKIIAADIAFHTRGLQYGGKEDTGARVAKKLFRTALILDIHFPGVPAQILFLSPKVTPATVPGVLDAERTAQSFFQGRRDDYRFRIIINEDFNNEVLTKVLDLQKTVDDTSELFLRAVQLMGLFNRKAPTPR